MSESRHGHLAAPGAQARLRELEKAAQKNLDDDYLAVAKTPQGGRVLCNIVYELGRLEQLSFAGSNNALSSLYEGKRAVGIEVANILTRVAPKEWRAIKAAFDAGKAEELFTKQDAEASGTKEQDT